MKVRAIGARNQWVGYYNHRRIRGGDVFELIPIVTIKNVDKDGNPDRKGKKREKITLTPEQQFSPRWMEKVDDTIPVSKPSSSNDLGNNRPRAQMAPAGAGSDEVI